MFNVLSKLHELVLAGGFVMPPLLAGCAVLWFALSMRLQTLSRGSRHGVRELFLMDADKIEETTDFLKYAKEMKARDEHHSDIVLAQAHETFSRGKTIITTVVMISPLLGLLGTVSGMIETFDSLGDMSLFSQTGGIAGGISQALVSTQMGLAVAIPGLIVGRLLGRKQNSLLLDLEQLSELKKAGKREVYHA